MSFVSLNDIWHAKLEEIQALTGDLTESFKNQALDNLVEIYKNKKINSAPDEQEIKYEIYCLHRDHLIQLYANNKRLDYLSYYFIKSHYFRTIGYRAYSLNNLYKSVSFEKANRDIDYDLRYAGI